MKSLKSLGIIGGMSPASTAVYYETINRLVNEALGGNASAPLLIHSLNFEQIAQYQRQNDWQSAAHLLANSAKTLVQAGADGILLATNTMHKVADAITDAVDVPFLHIADATADSIRALDLSTVALLGTAFTMQEDFYKARLVQFGITSMVPKLAEQAQIHQIIFEELTLGRILPASKQAYLSTIWALQSQGAQGVILGCTEIGLLISQADVDLPVFDTAAIHAKAAAKFILQET